MSGEYDSLGDTMAVPGQATAVRPEPLEIRAPPPPRAGTPVDKEMVKRALFPRRAGPVRIGRFTVLGQVGRGAMGVVYACYDDLLGRKVAVKLLSHAAAGEPEVAQARLLREAQALARLDHPNVVAIHDVGTYEDRVYLAMEFVEGQTLGAWLAAAPRSWREVVAVIVAAGEGLAAAHAKGLVHRDIKPDNIMVGVDGRVRVMDFGLAREGAPGVGPAAAARARATLSLSLTRTGAIMGTPAFMAPEQLLGEAIDARCDQFALCATAWEALHGQRPFAGETLPELVANVTGGVLTAPPRSKAPPWLRRVLERGLAREPAARFPDSAALLRALRADPTPRRRALAIAAGLCAVVAAGLGAAAVAEQRTLEACEAAAGAVAADWEGGRPRLEQAFLAAGAPHAATIFARTAPWFDRWAASWRDAARSACRAHRLEATWDGELYARAVDCLAEARGDFVALVDLAGVYYAAGAMDEAAALYARSLAIYAEVLGESHPQVATTLNNLALVHEAVGAYDEAVAALTRALAIREDTFGPEHPLVAASLGNLALVREAAGAYDEAARLFQRALALQEPRLGPDHPQVADTLHNLATVRFDTRDYAESARLLERARAIYARALGPDHPSTASSVAGLGLIHHATGDHAAALRLFAEALAIQERSLGADHPNLAHALLGRGDALVALGRAAEAVPELERALALREAGGVQPEELAEARFALARALWDAGADRARARRLAEQAGETYATIAGEDCASTGLCAWLASHPDPARGAE